MEKTYEIKTIQDLVDVATTDNINHLITNLHNLLRIAVFSGKQESDCVFKWIDDGRTDVYMNMRFEAWNKETKEELIKSLDGESHYDETTDEVVIPSFAHIIGCAYIKLPLL